MARTLLVHAFRAVVLRDPRLPAEALPGDWPEAPARALFARLYGELSPAANSFVAQVFASLDGAAAGRDRGNPAAAVRARGAGNPLNCHEEVCAEDMSHGTAFLASIGDVSAL